MFGVSLLKPKSEGDATAVACPVRGCRHVVPRQPTVFRATPDIKCPVHKIYVSESTFAYEREWDNLLWTDPESIALLNASKHDRSELRLSQDGSERALTWNVFRWLETSGVLEGLLESWTGRRVVAPRVVWWGFSQERQGVSLSLMRARSAFHEEGGDETEPAVIAETDDLLVFIDPRVSSARPSPRSPGGIGPYEVGAEGWAAHVLVGDCADLAGDRTQYELLRLWLLGTWMAAQGAKEFVLLHLVPSWSKAAPYQGAVTRFRQGEGRSTRRVHWEEIHTYVAARHSTAPGAAALRGYLEEKSAGYGSDGLLRRAFSLTAGADATAPVLAAAHLPVGGR